MPRRSPGGYVKTADDARQHIAGATAVRFCKPDANIAAGATGTVSIWTAGPAAGGSAVDAGYNDSGHAPIAVEALQWCVIETIAGDKYVLPFKCSV
jgi:hypothetical protein